jgi:hypothetical protein
MSASYSYARSTGALAGLFLIASSPAAFAQPASSIPPELLRLHNKNRDKHCVPRLRWSPELADSAQRWANRCLFVHDRARPRDQGENLARGTAPFSAKDAMEGWYDKEVRKYTSYDPPTGFTEATGHFTQVVWGSTTHVGCAIAVCRHWQWQWDRNRKHWVRVQARGNDWVCRYWPTGNITVTGPDVDPLIEFRRNVLPPRARCVR